MYLIRNKNIYQESRQVTTHTFTELISIFVPSASSVNNNDDTVISPINTIRHDESSVDRLFSRDNELCMAVSTDSGLSWRQLPGRCNLVVFNSYLSNKKQGQKTAISYQKTSLFLMGQVANELFPIQNAKCIFGYWGFRLFFFFFLG